MHLRVRVLKFVQWRPHLALWTSALAPQLAHSPRVNVSRTL
jgi:hypothetical protein